MNAEELARQAGTTTERVEQLAELGILVPYEGGDFPASGVHRVRLADALDRAGVSLEGMGEAIAAGGLTFGFIEQVFPSLAHPFLERTVAEVVEEAGLTMPLVERLYANWSLPAPDPNQRIRADDAEIIRGRGEMVRKFGLDTETLLGSSRFFGENLRRMAEAQARFFRTGVIDPIRGSGKSIAEVLEVIGPVARGMQVFSTRLRSELFDRHLEAYIFQQAVELVEAAMEEAGIARERVVHPPAIAFLDLGGYTRLTEQAGDDAAAEFAAQLIELVRRASNEYGGETVKLLGDGVMFHFTQPGQAVACGLELVESTERVGLPSARVGLHAGPVVYRDGDYFGRTVNLAARITDYARPREVLVSDTVADAASEHAEFEPIGDVALRGVLEPVSLFRAMIRHSSAGG